MKSSTKKLIRKNYQSVLFVCLAFLTMTLVSYFYSRSIVDNQMTIIAEEVMNTTETAVSGMLSESELSFSNISQTVDSMLSTGRSNEEILDFLVGMNDYFGGPTSPLPDFLKVYGYIHGAFLDGSGWIPPADYVPQMRPWYIGAIENPGEIFFSEPYLDADTGDMCISFSKEMTDESGALQGVLAIDLDLSRISNYIANQQIQKGGYGILVSDTLHLVEHPDEQLVGMNMEDIGGGYAQLARMIRDGEPVAGVWIDDIDGTHSIAYFRTIFNGWHIGTITPNAEYYRQVNELAVVLSILGFVLMVTLSYILVRMRAQQIRSEEENQSKSEFLSRMSHEMRTPMNAVLGLTEIARSTDDLDKIQYCLEQIHEASRHLLSVINDVLDMSKIEAGKLELEAAPFLLSDMLEQVTTMMQIKIDEKQQQFTLHIQPDVPDRLIGDRLRLSQVIINLLSNASKFTPEEGRIGLTVERIDDTDKCTLRFTVEDNGIGIPPEHQEKLFRSFEQVDGGVSRRYEGTGLGLAISQSIIEKMDGEITVDSMPGVGTRFIFFVRMECAPAEKSAVEMPLDQERPDDLQGIFAGKRALVAEDVQINQEILMMMLEETGLAVDCANDGQQACDMFAAQSGDYDIILMDVHMPDVDGYEATRRIRAMDIPAAQTVPIIAITANVFADDVQRCLDAGMNDHLGKPLVHETLMSKLKQYLLPPAPQA